MQLLSDHVRRDGTFQRSFVVLPAGPRKRGRVDKDADFTAYVAARGEALVRSTVLMGWSLPEAEDQVQTALMRCYGAWEKVTAADDIDAYVYRVLLNSLATGRRRKWWGERATEYLPERPGRDEADVVAVATAVRSALKRLPHQSRAVLVLRYFADLSEQHTAEALGLPVGTVKSRLSRARAELAADPHLADLPRNRIRP